MPSQGNFVTRDRFSFCHVMAGYYSVIQFGRIKSDVIRVNCVTYFDTVGRIMSPREASYLRNRRTACVEL